MGCVCQVHDTFLNYDINQTQLKPFENTPSGVSVWNLVKCPRPDFGKDDEDYNVNVTSLSYFMLCLTFRWSLNMVDIVL